MRSSLGMGLSHSSGAYLFEAAGTGGSAKGS